jgi:adenylylsulfate kinase
MYNSLSIWFSGRPGSGKRTIARYVQEILEYNNIDCEYFQRDTVSKHLDLGPRPLGDGDADAQRLSWLSSMLNKHNVNTIVVSPTMKNELATNLRESIPGFCEVFVDTPVEVCSQREGQWAAKAHFEEPEDPELIVYTHDRNIASSVSMVTSYIEQYWDITLDFGEIDLLEEVQTLD